MTGFLFGILGIQRIICDRNINAAEVDRDHENLHDGFGRFFGKFRRGHMSVETLKIQTGCIA